MIFQSKNVFLHKGTSNVVLKNIDLQTKNTFNGKYTCRQTRIGFFQSEDMRKDENMT